MICRALRDKVNTGRGKYDDDKADKRIHTGLFIRDRVREVLYTVAAQAEGRTGDQRERPHLAHGKDRHPHHGRRHIHPRGDICVPDHWPPLACEGELGAYLCAAVRSSVRRDRLSGRLGKAQEEAEPRPDRKQKVPAPARGSTGFRAADAPHRLHATEPLYPVLQ